MEVGSERCKRGRRDTHAGCYSYCTAVCMHTGTTPELGLHQICYRSITLSHSKIYLKDWSIFVFVFFLKKKKNVCPAVTSGVASSIDYMTSCYGRCEFDLTLS